MKNQSQNRRRNYFIKKRFQANFIIKFCALVAIGSIISGTIIYLMSKAALTTTFENSRLAIKSTADYILPAVLLSSSVVIVFIGLAAIIITLFASHKIAGPLYRMEKDIQEVAAGNLKKRFNLRKSDELKALDKSLDDMTLAIRQDIDKAKRGIAELESTAQSEEAKEKLKKLKNIIAKFNT